MLKDISAVIFDLDGTLVDSMWVWKQIDIEYLNKRGLSLPEDLQKNIQGLSFTETAHYFKNRFNLADEIETIKDEWNSMARNFYESVIQIKKGVKDFLEHLKTNGYKIALATSNSYYLTESVLKNNGIFQYFEAIVTTCEVPRDKSYPDVFLEAASRINVLPECCLVFEDSIAAVSGARLAGMKIIGVYDNYGTCTPKELEEVTDHIIEDFDSIVRVFNKK